MWDALVEKVRGAEGIDIGMFCAFVVAPVLFGLGFFIYAVTFVIVTGQKP